jgi:hypothetical protein
MSPSMPRFRKAPGVKVLTRAGFNAHMQFANTETIWFMGAGCKGAQELRRQRYRPAYIRDAERNQVFN